jgi:hypothetical protein
MFILLGTSFIAFGLAGKEYVEFSPLIGWGLGLLCQLLALVFAIKWERDKNGN